MKRQFKCVTCETEFSEYEEAPTCPYCGSWKSIIRVTWIH